MDYTPRFRLRSLSIFAAILFQLVCCLEPARLTASEGDFPILPGLEESVYFWKRVFTEYSSKQVIFHDPQEPGRIYEVIEASETPQGRRLMERERQSIKHEHGLKPRERRVRAQRGVKDRFALGLSRSQKHMDQIQQIFEEEGLPRELGYLPLVESFFDTSARSRVGAVGMWQFMRPTGRQFLKINQNVDERKDPLDSTRGAARLLKRNYQALGNWPLAVTAYNHGRDGMLRAVREVGTTDLVEIIRVYDSRTFGFVSKNFYAEFLAALEVVKESHEHFPELEYHPPFTLHELELARAVSVASLLKPLAVSRKEFFQWNPALNPRTEQIPKGYRVKVPAEKLDVFPPAFRRLAATEPVQAGSQDGGQTSRVRHRVARGETLWEIAKAYDTTVAAISRVNGIHRAHTLAVGQQLTIPRQ